MVDQAHPILLALYEVDRLRAAREAKPELAVAVRAVKIYQQARLERTHADLLASPRYAAAARFFLDDLYGPRDFSARDAQFARVVPALTRLFPGEVVSTVGALAELHRISEDLDQQMGARTLRVPLTRETYANAWRSCGRPDLRERQVELMVAIGEALDRYTRSPVLAGSLRLMRKPAAAAGLGSLQQFLEKGFATFRAIAGASAFIAIVAQRERALSARLFGAQHDATSLDPFQALP